MSLLRDAQRLEVWPGSCESSSHWPNDGAVVERDPEIRVGDPSSAGRGARRSSSRDHQLVEQADDVGARADHEALVGERALQGAGAAEPLAALEHEHAAPGPRQVGGRGEPVVAAADDDRVPVAGGEVGDRLRQPDLAELGGDLVRDLASLPASRGDLRSRSASM